jgi:hypothetical protein
MSEESGYACADRLHELSLSISTKLDWAVGYILCSLERLYDPDLPAGEMLTAVEEGMDSTIIELENAFAAVLEFDRLIVHDDTYHELSKYLGDLERLTWSDIDFDQGIITIRGGKAKRVDQVPIHPQLQEALRKRLRDTRAKVFSSSVTSRTQRLDFLRAGLAREEVVKGQQGKPVMVGSGNRLRPKTRIVTEDEDGRVIDLHALRTTLGTQLARAGVAPQIAQKIMRHGDYRTTLKHYTVLGLSDTSKAVAEIPSIKSPGSDSQQATGTTDERPHSPRQLGRETRQFGAKSCAERSASESQPAQHKTRSSGALSGSERALAKKRVIGIEPTTFSLGS